MRKLKWELVVEKCLLAEGSTKNAQKTLTQLLVTVDDATVKHH
jgi:hypothetical protein